MVETAHAISSGDEETIAQIVALRQRIPPEPLGALLEGTDTTHPEMALRPAGAQLPDRVHLANGRSAQAV
jgi:hypothetical protein